MQRRQDETVEEFFWRLATTGATQGIRDFSQALRKELGRRDGEPVAPAALPDPTTPETLRYAADVIQAQNRLRYDEELSDMHPMSPDWLRTIAERLDPPAAVDTEVEELARELHAMQWSKSWDEHTDAARGVYRDRARRLIVEGWSRR